MTAYRSTPTARTARAARTVRIAGAVAACAALSVAATACQVTEDVKKSERTYMVKGGAKEISATTSGGNITVIATDGDSGAIRVTERYRYSEQKPVTEHSVANGRLTLKQKNDDCGGTSLTCTVSYDVRVPRSMITDLHTDGGDVVVRGLAGDIGAETEGGDVTIEESSAKKATARTSGGDVDAEFTGVPDRVDGRTSGGNVTIRLPKGSYAVDATTSGGTRKVSGPTDGRAPHKIKAHTDGGDVSVSSPS
ncbi:DUF4097 family beta strand repeat-containing protein [Streptomyces sp. MST-110588]|uniref:DUF4097 family beta strand repeat-containing protein n=1 Tax=Streptomyces sp. MST-110588 TaxID=2833628 RepID=UPI001F5CB68F|nr:DUF4097 family beta strand repeat-containing protein [Streptomyces sp. MST-110588]UNO42243.1 DUF4097 family beta strand repeat protein [Streptomyces sp. MST-110588]